MSELDGISLRLSPQHEEEDGMGKEAGRPSLPGIPVTYWQWEGHSPRPVMSSGASRNDGDILSTSVLSNARATSHVRLLHL